MWSASALGRYCAANSIHIWTDLDYRDQSRPLRRWFGLALDRRRARAVDLVADRSLRSTQDCASPQIESEGPTSPFEPNTPGTEAPQFGWSRSVPPIRSRGGRAIDAEALPIGRGAQSARHGGASSACLPEPRSCDGRTGRPPQSVRRRFRSCAPQTKSEVDPRCFVTRR